MTNAFAGWLSLSSRERPARVGAGLTVVGFCPCLVLVILWKHCIARQPHLRRVGWVVTLGCPYHSLESLARRKYPDRHPQNLCISPCAPPFLPSPHPLTVFTWCSIFTPLSSDGCIFPSLNFPGLFLLLHSPVQVPGD